MFDITHAFVYEVSNIGASSFYNARKLESITISNTITEIGENAFASAFSLKSFHIPS